MREGDWIEQRDAPNTRGLLRKLVPGHGCRVQLSGDYRPATYHAHDLEAFWEPMQFAGDLPPFWCRKGTEFVPSVPLWMPGKSMDPRALILDLRPGWVAYRSITPGSARHGQPSCFMMLTWWEFRKRWEPATPPTAWDHVLNDED